MDGKFSQVEEQKDDGSSLLAPNFELDNNKYSHRLKKSEILRGFSSFNKILCEGIYLKEDILSCFYSLSETSEFIRANMTVGFASKRTKTKIQRNRNIRIIRESFRLQKTEFHTICQDKKINLLVVFMISSKTKKSYLTLELVKELMSNLMKHIEASC